MAEDEYRALIEAELIPHWRTPLPPNPSPAQEVEAWQADATMILRAARRVDARLHREAIERHAAALDRIGL